MKRIRLNKKLLLELLMTETPYGEEDKVVKIIERELNQLGFEYKQDRVGNIIAQRGNAKKYPLLNAHMDIVDLNYSWYGNALYGVNYYDQSTYIEDIIDIYGTELLSECVGCMDCIHSNDCFGYEEDLNIDYGHFFKLCNYFVPTLESENKIIKWAENNGLMRLDWYEDSNYKIIEENGVLRGQGKYRVLGGDDKCGIFLALELARATTIPMKLLFTVGEEVGCIGIKHFITTSPHWFKDVAYSITIDRRGADNLLSSQLGVRSCTRRFAAKLAQAGIMENIPIKIEDGSLADVVYIREVVKDAVNVSAGYYNPHTEDEYVVWKDVVGIFKWLKRFIES